MAKENDKRLQDALKELTDFQGTTWESEREQLANEPHNQPDPHKRADFIASLDNTLNQRKKCYIPIKKLIIAIAVIAIALGAFSWNVDAIRSAWFGVKLDEQDLFSEVSVEQLLEEGKMPIDTTAFNMPTYVPWGYHSANINTQFRVVNYIDNNGHYISFMMLNLDEDYNLDTENATIEYIKVNQFNAIYLEKSEYKNLTWTDDQYIFVLESDQTSKKQLLKMAESVQN